MFHDERWCCRKICYLKWHLIPAVVVMTVPQIQNAVDQNTPGGKTSLRLEDESSLIGPMRRAESRRKTSPRLEDESGLTGSMRRAESRMRSPGIC